MVKETTGLVSRASNDIHAWVNIGTTCVCVITIEPYHYDAASLLMEQSHYPGSVPIVTVQHVTNNLYDAT